MTIGSVGAVMMIAEVAAVRRAHPGAPEAAVQHLMWALHRSHPLLAAGDPAAGRALRADLAGYPGSLADFDQLGVPALLGALTAGEHAVADTLSVLRLAQPGTGSPGARRGPAAGDRR